MSNSPEPSLADLLRLDQQLCFALYTASRLMTRAYRPVLDPLGLTYPQYLAMLVLWEERTDGRDAPTVARLGERLLLDSGTLTPLLKRLEAQGLVRRRRSEIDEREVRVELTEAGEALRARALQVPLAMLCQVDATPNDLVDLRERIRALISAFPADDAT